MRCEKFISVYSLFSRKDCTLDVDVFIKIEKIKYIHIYKPSVTYKRTWPIFKIDNWNAN